MIKVEKILKKYPNGENDLVVLNHLSFEIKKGSFTTILGPSGSGKTTLLNVLSGLEKADQGSVFYDKDDIELFSQKELVEFRKKNVAFVFQCYYLIPTLNVYSNIKMAANLNGNKDFRNVIESLGLRGKEKKMPALLSGGEQQRVAIARAIAKEPTILFCDEPTGALDEATGRQVMSILLDLNKKGMTIVMVTHNENLARITSNIIRMNSGNIVSNNKNVTVKLEEIKW